MLQERRLTVGSARARSSTGTPRGEAKNRPDRHREASPLAHRPCTPRTTGPEVVATKNKVGLCRC
jgi:hypothetical protein